MSPRSVVVLLAVVAVLSGGLGWWIGRPPVPIVTEAAAPAVTQPDGSKVLARAPDATAKPAHQVPKGSTVERIEQVKLIGPGLKMPGGEVRPCPPVTADLTLVRDQDGGRRVIASSPDGEVVGGVDIPVETAASPAASRVWAAGLSLDPVRQAAGIWVERDIGRVRIGVDVAQVSRSWGVPGGVEARVRVGWTF